MVSENGQQISDILIVLGVNGLHNHKELVWQQIQLSQTKV